MKSLLFLFLFSWSQTFAQDNPPWVGQSRDAASMKAHENLLNQTATHLKDINIVFLGDSITRRWAEDGKAIWAKYYTPRHAYNYGVGGDRTEHVIWRIEHKELDGTDPKVVVLKIGTNNIGPNTAEDIARGIKQIITLLETKLPQTKILLLGILPRAGSSDNTVKAVNTIIAKYADNKKVFYLDMSAHFEDSPGKEKVGLYKDTVHLTEKGYQVWHDVMEPELKKILPAEPQVVSHPWIGLPKDESWIKKHEGLLNTTAMHGKDIKIIFDGDSITSGWGGNGKEIWAKYYAPRHAYNYGIGGDRIENLIWRVEHKEFDGLKPNVVILKIGTNNMKANTEEDIAHGIKQLINLLFMKMPETKVLLLGILPRPGSIETKVQNINTIISKYADEKKVWFLDMSPHFQDSPGKEKTGLYVDGVHLTKEGYQVWYETMEPLLKKLNIS